MPKTYLFHVISSAEEVMLPLKFEGTIFTPMTPSYTLHSLQQISLTLYKN